MLELERGFWGLHGKERGLVTSICFIKPLDGGWSCFDWKLGPAHPKLPVSEENRREPKICLSPAPKYSDSTPTAESHYGRGAQQPFNTMQHPRLFEGTTSTVGTAPGYAGRWLNNNKKGNILERVKYLNTSWKENWDVQNRALVFTFITCPERQFLPFSLTCF